MTDSPEIGPSDDDLSVDGTDTVVTLLAEMTDADRLRLEPPPSVWKAIVATISADRNGTSDHTLSITGGGDGSIAADLSPIEREATTTIALGARRRSTDQPMVPAEMGGWRRQWLPVAAAVAVTIVGGLVTWAFSDEIAGTDAGGQGRPAAFEGEVVAVTEITDEGLLDSPTAIGGIGEARLVRSGDRYHLDIELDVTELPPVDGYYELWVVDPDLDGLISLGVLAGDGSHALPGTLDPAEYPVVDVSIEALDGDPSHSGRTAWRGHLDG